MAAYYTSVSKIYDRLGAVQSVTTLTSRQLFTGFIQPVEGRMNASLARLYTVPITNAPLLIGIATDLAYAKALIEHIYTGQTMRESNWPILIRNSALKMLEQISTGELLLTNSAGTIIATRSDVAQVTSNTKDYEPTFGEDNILDNVIDDDKLDDYADRRDLSRDWLT